MERFRKHKGEYKTTCSKCGNELEYHRKGKYRYCLKCHAESVKKYRNKNMDIVNVINLPERTLRLQLFKMQAEQQKFNYRVWEGIKDLVAVFRGISHAHKQIIWDAKNKKLERVFVAEDDCRFTGVGAWEYFLSKIPESFDIFFGGVYEGKINDEGRLIRGNGSFELLSGLTLYCVHERFYDIFMDINDMDNLDKKIGELANDYEFYVCDPFVVVQENGYSDNKKAERNYDHLLKGRKLFGVNS